ncbi:MAG: alpha-amylase family glycosyl hydrolase [Cytophagaceae bacterium]
MHNLVSTYRIQFHKGFTFEDFTSTISYLKELGVQTVYASPVFAATPGSTHGYDGIDSHHINPEIGSEKQLRELSKKLQKENMFWLQDIVPNHMAFHSANNWLMDVLEKGQRSRYASFFDISQTSDLNNGRLMVPFLGAPLEELFHSGEVKINYKEHGFAFTYYDNHYPLSPESYIEILQTKEDTPQAVKKIISSIKDLQRVEDKEIFAKQWKEIRLQMGSLMKNSTVRDFVEECLNKINSSPEDLKRLSDLQAYRMCHWQETDKKINYRRFFTINGLICLNIQTQEVFDHYHSYIRTFLEEGIIQGLRIDHIDGLFDPTVYLENLRTMAGKDTHITVEKILEPGESLPQKWPIQGNTGYDFLSLPNNLFTNSDTNKNFTYF